MRTHDSAPPASAVRHTPARDLVSVQHERLYYPAFDWLRAVLAITVMLYHDRVIQWGDAGKFAVVIFFVLSGWLIGRILLKTSPAGLPKFYFKRAVRIWVPYYVALLLLVAASLLRDQVTPKWVEFVTYKLLMVWNLFGNVQVIDGIAQMPLKGTGNHFWSVNAEEQFYLLSPLLLVLAPGWGRSLLVWCALALGALLMQSYYAGILLGVAAAIATANYGALHQTRPAQAGLALIAVASAAGLSAGGAVFVLAPIFGLAAVLLLASPGAPSRLATTAGGMSYPLYLNHWIGVFAANALFAPFGMRDSAWRWVLSSVLNIAVAVGLYLLIDRKLLQRRETWYSPHTGKVTTIAAYSMVALGIAVGLTLKAAAQ